MIKFKYLILLIFAFNVAIPVNTLAKNRMQKTNLQTTKKGTMKESVNTNKSFYKAKARDIARHYKIQGKEEENNIKTTSAGSNIIQAGNNSVNIIINESYAPQTNIAIGSSESGYK